MKICDKCNGFGNIYVLKSESSVIVQDGDNWTYSTKSKIVPKKCDKCDGKQRVNIFAYRPK